MRPLLGSIWEAFVCVSMSIALLALFKDRFNSQGPMAKALADNSFTVYLIHIPIIIILQNPVNRCSDRPAHQVRH